MAGFPAPKAPKPPTPKAPAGPPGPPAASTPGVVPPTPGKMVKFKHPTTGEESTGHIHAQGVHGATIVDGTGATHKLPHGSYMHHDDPGAPDQKPQADLIRAAARKHLQLGLDAPLAVHGVAMLLAAGTTKPFRVHELQAPDVTFGGKYAFVDNEKLQTDDPDVVRALRELQQRNPKGPLFAINGKPITEESLVTYARRFGTPGGNAHAAHNAPAQGPAPVGPQTELAKAAASALELPDPGTLVEKWDDCGYTCNPITSSRR